MSTTLLWCLIASVAACTVLIQRRRPVRLVTGLLPLGVATDLMLSATTTLPNPFHVPHLERLSLDWVCLLLCVGTLGLQTVWHLQRLRA